MSSSHTWTVFDQHELIHPTAGQSQVHGVLLDPARSVYDESRTFKIRDSDNLTTPLPTFFQVENALRLDQTSLSEENISKGWELAYPGLPQITGVINRPTIPAKRKKFSQSHGGEDFSTNAKYVPLSFGDLSYPPTNNDDLPPSGKRREPDDPSFFPVMPPGGSGGPGWELPKWNWPEWPSIPTWLKFLLIQWLLRPSNNNRNNNRNGQQQPPAQPGPNEPDELPDAEFEQPVVPEVEQPQPQPVVPEIEPPEPAVPAIEPPAPNAPAAEPETPAVVRPPPPLELPRGSQAKKEEQVRRPPRTLAEMKEADPETYKMIKEMTERPAVKIEDRPVIKEEKKEEDSFDMGIEQQFLEDQLNNINAFKVSGRNPRTVKKDDKDLKQPNPNILPLMPGGNPSMGTPVSMQGISGQNPPRPPPPPMGTPISEMDSMGNQFTPSTEAGGYPSIERMPEMDSMGNRFTPSTEAGGYPSIERTGPLVPQEDRRRNQNPNPSMGTPISMQGNDNPVGNPTLPTNNFALSIYDPSSSNRDSSLSGAFPHTVNRGRAVGGVLVNTAATTRANGGSFGGIASNLGATFSGMAASRIGTSILRTAASAYGVPEELTDRVSELAGAVIGSSVQNAVQRWQPEMDSMGSGGYPVIERISPLSPQEDSMRNQGSLRGQTFNERVEEMFANSIIGRIRSGATVHDAFQAALQEDIQRSQDQFENTIISRMRRGATFREAFGEQLMNDIRRWGSAESAANLRSYQRGDREFKFGHPPSEQHGYLPPRARGEITEFKNPVNEPERIANEIEQAGVLPELAEPENEEFLRNVANFNAQSCYDNSTSADEEKKEATVSEPPRLEDYAPDVITGDGRFVPDWLYRTVGYLTKKDSFSMALLSAMNVVSQYGKQDPNSFSKDKLGKK
jgi:hypothetical protein